MSMTMSATYIYTHGAIKNKWKLPIHLQLLNFYQHVEENDQVYIEFFSFSFYSERSGKKLKYTQTIDVKLLELIL